MMFYHAPFHYKHHYEDKFIMATANATLVAMLFVSVLDSFNYSFTCMILIVSSLLFEDIIKWTGAERT